MDIKTTGRGFEIAEFTDCNGQSCSLQQSSAISDSQPGGWDNPGSSYVWLGVGDSRMHLDRGKVAELMNRLDAWLKNGSFLFTAERQNCNPG